VPVIHTDGEFGQWYFGKGPVLASLPAINAIDMPHERRHALYVGPSTTCSRKRAMEDRQFATL